MIAHLLAVDAQLVVAQPADVGAGAHRAPLQDKLLAKLIGAADPLPLPLRRRQQPHFEGGRFAVSAGPIGLVPVAHLPVVGLAAPERFAVEGDERGFFRLDPPAVPNIAGLDLRLQRDQHLVGDLLLAALGVLEHPGKARPRDVDPDRILQVLGPQPRRGRRHEGGSRLSHSTGRAQREKSDSSKEHAPIVGQSEGCFRRAPATKV